MQKRLRKLSSTLPFEGNSLVFPSKICVNDSHENHISDEPGEQPDCLYS